MVDDGGLFHGQLGRRPGEVREQLVHLLMGAQFASNELTGAKWIRNCGHHQCQNARIQEATVKSPKYPGQCQLSQVISMGETHFFCKNVFIRLFDRMNMTYFLCTHT